jgi:exodeoxyribonuclease VII large subunit
MPLFPDEVPSERVERSPGREVEVLTVFELDNLLRREVEKASLGIRVEGEVQGAREVASGHLYFTLKDGERDASIGCVLYRSGPVRARRLLKDGARVVLMGRATIYSPRGQLQFVADDARLAGRGALLEALELLKKKLAAEGLFRPEKKRKLPTDPRVVGVVTSKDGAALHDIVKVAFRRSRVRIVLARAPVQGAQAGAGLARALAALGKHPEVEVIILGRGGGSADDLAAFNDEALVRAVAASRVPVVSAVGHETDTSLVDLAADARAATPSQAAEIVLPDSQARREMLHHAKRRLSRAIERRIGENVVHLDRLEGALTQRMRTSLERKKTAVAKLERRVSIGVYVCGKPTALKAAPNIAALTD